MVFFTAYKNVLSYKLCSETSIKSLTTSFNLNYQKYGLTSICPHLYANAVIMQILYLDFFINRYIWLTWLLSMSEQNFSFLNIFFQVLAIALLYNIAVHNSVLP